jgi:hypothetical protein
MALITNEGRRRLWIRTTGAVDVLADTLKMMLLTSSYTPDKDHQFISDLTNELSGTGYAAGFGGSGRKTMTTKAIVKDTTNDIVKLTADNPTWTAINAGTARYLAVVKEVTSDADSPVLAILDINASAGVTTDGNDLPLAFGTNGVISSASA